MVKKSCYRPKQNLVVNYFALTLVFLVIKRLNEKKSMSGKNVGIEMSRSVKKWNQE